MIILTNCLKFTLEYFYTLSVRYYPGKESEPTNFIIVIKGITY